MRLYGGYLAPAMAFLPFHYFYAVRDLDARAEKTVKLVILIALFSCLLYSVLGFNTSQLAEFVRKITG